MQFNTDISPESLSQPHAVPGIQDEGDLYDLVLFRQTADQRYHIPDQIIVDPFLYFLIDKGIIGCQGCHLFAPDGRCLIHIPGIEPEGCAAGPELLPEGILYGYQRFFLNAFNNEFPDLLPYLIVHGVVFSEILSILRLLHSNTMNLAASAGTFSCTASPDRNFPISSISPVAASQRDTRPPISR